MTILELLMVVLVIAIIAAIAIPRYTKFIQSSRETAALSYVGKIIKAEEVFRLYDASGLYTDDFSGLEDTGFLTFDGATPDVYTVEGYTFTLAAGVSAGVPVWDVGAAPAEPSAKKMWFFADQSGTIRCSRGSGADSSSPPCSN